MMFPAVRIIVFELLILQRFQGELELFYGFQRQVYSTLLYYVILINLTSAGASRGMWSGSVSLVQNMVQS